MVKKTAPEQPPEKSLVGDKSTKTIWENILIVGVIVFITCMVVVATTGMRERWDKQEQVGKELCQNHSFIYKRLNSLPNSIVCETNITYNAEHYNISPETLEVFITPDWDYYLNTTKKEN
jgi:hypothetical protein